MAEEKRDIVERLKEACGFGDRAGTADSDINVMVRTVPLKLLEDAISEIEFLRLHAGAVTRGESFADIADRVGRKAQRKG